MLSNKQKIENIYNLFLEWNVGDARKAGHWLPNSWESLDRDKITKIHPNYDGGAMVGATILAMCVISSVAQFSDKSEDEQFKWFVDQYLKPLNNNYDGERMYALRCSLIKNYALLARVSEKGKKNPNPIKIPFALTDIGSHFEPSEFGVLFNVKTFILHIQLGMQTFFTNVLMSKESDIITDKIVKYYDTMKIGPIQKKIG